MLYSQAVLFNNHQYYFDAFIVHIERKSKYFIERRQIVDELTKL